MAPGRSIAASIALNALLVGAMIYMTFAHNGASSGNLGAVMGGTMTRDVSVNARKNQFQSGRRCGLTGKTGQTAYKYCFSHKRATKRQFPNIQQKYIYWPDGQRMVKLKVSTAALKTIEKRGLEAMAKEAGIDLNKLPFKDMRPERTEYVKKHSGEVPMSKKWVSGYWRKVNKMKNPEKIAASKKSQRVGKYYHGKIFFGRFTEAQLEQLNDVGFEEPQV
ncbi:hypothetical protein AAMO2058_000202200 [Amorphochlora amoebiformis]